MVIAILIAAVIIAVFVGLFAAYYKVFYFPKKNRHETEDPPIISNHPYHDTARERIAEITDIPCEFISTRSYDGLKLSARFYRGNDKKPLIICFHGYHGYALRDYSGIGLYLIQQDYPVILVDERAHQRSEGHTITFGIRERHDALSWIEYVRDHFGKNRPVYLHGISLGGGTVLMASGLELPENVKGIIADCPFNDPEKIIRYVCRLIKLNPDICWPIIKLSALIYGRFNINQTTAAQEVTKTTKPILIIHGDADDFVPEHMSAEVQKANPAMVERHLIADAGHGLSYYYDPEQYESIVKVFIDRTIHSS